MNSTGPAQKHCPDCGAIFECAMAPDTPCWCSLKFARVMPVPEAGAHCYCPNCLSIRVALEQRKTASKGPV
ncbi:MAG TPA: cysteine-rich CWC family protein [Burkholderiales bacterium]|nr:cysteine-rich CWC family protein [Burkholderiales bacterium]